MKSPLLSFAFAAFIAAPVPAFAVGKGQPMTIPDFTKGDAIPAGAKHDWNLGPTGLRGWMFCDKMVTADARQISITRWRRVLRRWRLARWRCPPWSRRQALFLRPAHRVRQGDHRRRNGSGRGRLTVTRWRAGKVEEVVVKLPVLGSYSVTAPFACPKSKRILEQGCKALAERVAKPSHEEDPLCVPSMRSRYWPAAIPPAFAGQE